MSNEQEIEHFQNPTFAVMDGDVVTNIVVARDIETATRLFGKVIQYHHTIQVGIGWTYDEKTNSFVNSGQESDAAAILTDEEADNGSQESR